MRLLVSVQNLKEALEAFEGGANIVDVKNPREGALGANFPWVIKQVKENIPRNVKVEISATIGDLPYLPGTASLAALGAAVSAVNYVKAGLFGVKSLEEAVELMYAVNKAVKDWDSKIKVIVAGYADHQSFGCLNPLSLPLVAYKSGVDGVMVDVKQKDSRKLFDYIQIEELKNFVKETHRLGLIAALAGSLGFKNLSEVLELDADVIGVRRAVCLNGEVSKDLVKKLAVTIETSKIILEQKVA